MRSTSVVRAGAIGAVLVAAAGVFDARGQTTGPKIPPLVITSTSGRDLFQFYCAPCHGRAGRGDGPAAPALKTRPADLTRIASRRGGKFPSKQIEAFITGGDSPATGPAHGSKDMPVWGPIFQGLDPRDTLTRIRLENVVSFLASIQEK